MSTNVIHRSERRVPDVDISVAAKVDDYARDVPGLDADSLRNTLKLLGDLSLPMRADTGADIAETGDALSAFMTKLKYIEPLAQESQTALAKKYNEDGDELAGRLLVVTNLRLVVKIAREYQRNWADLMDLVQEGSLGLVEALSRYDPYRGVQFTSYAQYWIRALIMNYLMNHKSVVRLGGSRAGRKLFYNLKKARRALIRRGHRRPTPQQIGDYLDVDPKEVVRLASNLDQPPKALDAPIGDGQDSTTYADRLRDDAPGPDEVAAEHDAWQRLKAAVQEYGENLPKEREVDIWFNRTISDEPLTLADLGDRYGVSRERIRQVEVRLRRQFKEFLEERYGDEVEVTFND